MENKGEAKRRYFVSEIETTKRAVKDLQENLVNSRQRLESLEVGLVEAELEASKERLEELELLVLQKEKQILLLRIETQEAKEQLEEEKSVFCQAKKKWIKIVSNFFNPSQVELLRAFLVVKI
ncbi:Oidioi.mRNA.OKI2018_I69.PAR.g11212.t1.cds [Oikopleura dioica]|uniref:Oidioi.mRNA.OKI2018_I69.PAR.g11212.t1.cds n=1 Tax=Oikopleura dioica TaxID=34765 RepID=A0ABN7RV47_OIKDI|nr:Oidioi.mRNA.OKI2018_I69.PAR.g11212.t1.cds [Oikopleura dioica]